MITVIAIAITFSLLLLITFGKIPNSIKSTASFGIALVLLIFSFYNGSTFLPAVFFAINGVMYEVLSKIDETYLRLLKSFRVVIDNEKEDEE